ncbi:MAG TPA: hypothetical protein DDW52_28490 [Planctomycetaceae bacterium]|nr:hypothetical protein [Planctomycetaceae bacterium]
MTTNTTTETLKKPAHTSTRRWKGRSICQHTTRPALNALKSSAQDVKPWILSIDDDEDFSGALKLRLQTQGYDVVRAFAVDTGYQFAFDFEPAAILLDLNLPTGSGEELLSQLRYHPETAHIPILVVTGMNEPGLERRILAAGAYAFFRKPISHTSLLEALQKANNDGSSV